MGSGKSSALAGVEGFAQNPFIEPARVTLTVVDYEANQVIGYVRREREEGFDWKKRILGVQTRPATLDTYLFVRMCDTDGVPPPRMRSSSPNSPLPDAVKPVEWTF